MVEGMILIGEPETIGRTYQWSLDSVLMEDTPDEVTMVQRLIEEYETETR